MMITVNHSGVNCVGDDDDGDDDSDGDNYDNDKESWLSR